MSDFAGRTDRRDSRDWSATRCRAVVAYCCLTALLAGCRTPAEVPAPPIGSDRPARHVGPMWRDVPPHGWQQRPVLYHRVGHRGTGHVRLRPRRLDRYLFPQRAPLQGAPRPEVPPANALYRNEGAWQFADISSAAGVADLGYGLGVTVGDYDNDGYADLYLNNYGPNVLYHNNGDGTFSDVTAAAGVANGDRVGAGTAFLDFDQDGDLDLYVANYVDFSYEEHKPNYIDGLPAIPGPLNYRPMPDVLYRNEGDGTFSDISVESGIGVPAGTGMGVTCGITTTMETRTSSSATTRRRISSFAMTASGGSRKSRRPSGRPTTTLGIRTRAWRSIARISTTMATSIST